MNNNIKNVLTETDSTKTGWSRNWDYKTVTKTGDSQIIRTFLHLDKIDLLQLINEKDLDKSLSWKENGKLIRVNVLDSSIIKSFSSKGKKVNYIIETELMDVYRYE